MAFGVPLPICSCAVIPLYRTLVVHGVPTSAALAFMVATPELGIDAVLISLPLLGTELTILRLVCAALVAFVVGWLIGRIALARPATAHAEPHFPSSTSDGWLGRLGTGLRFGFGEIVDHVGPWLLLGLTLAAVIEPMLRGHWIAALPWGVDVALFALLGMPSYVCASGAMPLVAILIHKGVSPGAAIAFLLTGPATNMTTFRVLADLHGRPLAAAFGGAIAAMSIGLGLGVNLLFPEVPPSLGERGAQDAHGTLSWLGLAGLGVVLAASVIRQGPRGFLAQVLAPYGDDADGGHDHGHGHDHDHDHDQPGGVGSG
jgi:uncharacterized membrane protein YraQ (UPF0718 family)